MKPISEILYKYNAGQISVNEATEMLKEREKEVAVNFAVDVVAPFTTDGKEILRKYYSKVFDQWQQPKTSDNE